MGINKPDVRFVIHQTLSKSVEGYHQETGRAGRNGQEAWAILYYSYQDVRRIQQMMEESCDRWDYAAQNQLEQNKEALNAMVSYCEQKTECRRVLLLSHFGENDFTADMCERTCDICKDSQKFDMQDVSEAGRQLIQLVFETDQKLSKGVVQNIFRGSQSKKLRRYQKCRGFGGGKDLGSRCVESLMRALIARKILVDETYRQNNQYGTVCSRLKVDQHAAMGILNQAERVLIPVQQQVKQLSAKKSVKTSVKRKRGELMENFLIKNCNVETEGDGEDSFEDDFEEFDHGSD
eukprot:TRINITY_DN25472_c0_g1_i1.p2 TRINITY_DN25472_c0_g1~~TRINITY_DN25472_c0_g1_i1.p2  ORF type:complete len:292 (-),score=42.56 TRINITY_DN25472_c0_g1_i1:47-922(-)